MIFIIILEIRLAIVIAKSKGLTQSQFDLKIDKYKYLVRKILKTKTQ